MNLERNHNRVVRAGEQEVRSDVPLDVSEHRSASTADTTAAKAPPAFCWNCIQDRDLVKDQQMIKDHTDDIDALLVFVSSPDGVNHKSC